MNPEDFECERKFLVRDRTVIEPLEGTTITQGYLGAAGGYSVRVRLVPAQDLYSLTVKGPRRNAERLEMETQISAEIATALLHAAGSSIVEKKRYPIVGPDGMIWTVDIFFELNEGLVLAEIELSSSDETFAVPEWCGDEVTDDERYYNEFLSRNPYATWNESD